MAERGIRIRGARLIYRTAAKMFDRPEPGCFIDGDIIEFDIPTREIIAGPNGTGQEVPLQCFRLGSGGSTLTPVERGSWLR